MSRSCVQPSTLYALPLSFSRSFSFVSTLDVIHNSALSLFIYLFVCSFFHPFPTLLCSYLNTPSANHSELGHYTVH